MQNSKYKRHLQKVYMALKQRDSGILKHVSEALQVFPAAFLPNLLCNSAILKHMSFATMHYLCLILKKWYLFTIYFFLAQVNSVFRREHLKCSKLTSAVQHREHLSTGNTILCAIVDTFKN